MNNTIFCGNCGKSGHMYRDCSRPITSYGIICFKKHNASTSTPTHYQTQQNIFNQAFDIILIQRKFTIGYMEFIRGKYMLDNDTYLLQIFEMMTQSEKNDILIIHDYDILRRRLGTDRNTTSYRREYTDGKHKFNTLLFSGKLVELMAKSIAISPNWMEPEWGLPKGRRNGNETDLACAKREFIEESGIHNIRIFENIIPLEELYTGINNIKYRHIYYIAEFITDITTATLSNEINININIPEQYNEISTVKWMDDKMCSQLIRPYYVNKLNVINKAFQIIKYLNVYFE